MSWTDELYKVYENNCGRTDCEELLLPIFHSTANSQIEVTINELGEFVSAAPVAKEDAVTVIPVTEASGSRSSGIAPHPLNDKLIYIAGDFIQYSASKKADNTKYYEAYMSQLEKWCNSSCSHAGVKAIYTYLKKKSIISDLITVGVLKTDSSTDKLIENVKINGIDREECFVRFIIHYNDILRTSKTWNDTTLYDSFINHNTETLGDKQLCYATGKLLPCTYKHPSKIRNAGDKAKLISSNDESGFSYRGRFDNKEQANSISFDFSQKIHNALKWLIARQGIRIDSLMLIIWESSMQEMPDIIKSGVEGFGFEFDDEPQIIDTFPAYQKYLSSMIWGYKDKLDINSKVMIAAFDAATTGRLSMSIYSEISGSAFYDNIESWHRDTSWFKFDTKTKKTIIDSFSIYDIIDAAFGTEQGKFLSCKPEIKKGKMLKLIPCVIEGRHIPQDIINALVQKASSPLSYAEGYNHRKVLEIACGLIKKAIIEKNIYKEGELIMGLDENYKDRSYLFGRLLAVADAAEYNTYSADEKGRITNAKRYWSNFAQNPYQTWQIIEERLRPYLDKSGGKSVFYTKMINSIMTMMSPEDFMLNKRLAPLYLLGYHCQLNEIYKSNKNEEEK